MEQINKYRKCKVEQEIDKYNKLKSLREKLEVKIKELNIRMEKQYKQITCAKWIANHPHIIALEICLLPLEIIKLCLDFIGDNYCIECDKLFPTLLCYHKSPCLRYDTIGRIKLLQTCKCNINDVSYFYSCIYCEIENDYDMRYFSYCDSVLCGKFNYKTNCKCTINYDICLDISSNGINDVSISDSRHDATKNYCILYVSKDCINELYGSGTVLTAYPRNGLYFVVIEKY